MKLKYRAWKKTNSPEMFHDIAFINFNENVLGINYPVSSLTTRLDSEPLDNVILMQSTGLKDKNGVDIYEGDIVKPDRGKPFVVGHFISGQGIFEFALIANDGHGFRGIYHGSSVEIIGNIYSNPELLEDK